jgi:hypothetical protein
MSREELRTKIYHLILNTENDSVLENVLLFLENSSLDELIPGLPRTDEEKLASVERGMEEYRQGNGITHEEFLEEQKTWRLIGSLKPEML